MKKLIDMFPEIAAEWHPTKNQDLEIAKISYGSAKKVWWVCSKGHEYQSRIDGRTGQNRGCPYCNNHKKRFPVSVSHPHLVSEWHIKNSVKPEEVTAGSIRKIWWLGKCGHEWEAHLHNRANGYGCPYCANKLADSTNSLLAKHSELADQWHSRNELSANEVNYKTWKKYWWLGKCGHEWEASVRCRTLRGNGCPTCQESKGEKQVEKVLNSLNLSYVKQKRFPNCKDKRTLPFDFYLDELNILIEYQGKQHYEPLFFGGDCNNLFELIKKHDTIKENWCNENEIKLIAIPYTKFKDIEEIIKMEVNRAESD